MGWGGGGGEGLLVCNWDCEECRQLLAIKSSS